jgi:hypothetical protein
MSSNSPLLLFPIVEQLSPAVWILQAEMRKHPGGCSVRSTGFNRSAVGFMVFRFSPSIFRQFVQRPPLAAGYGLNETAGNSWGQLFYTGP